MKGLGFESCGLSDWDLGALKVQGFRDLGVELALCIAGSPTPRPPGEQAVSETIPNHNMWPSL